MNQDIEALLYSYLLKAQRKASIFSAKEEQQIIKVCAQYLTAGFVLESNRLDPANVGLLNGLKGQRRLTAIKFMSMKQDLKDIAQSFNRQNIDFLVLKGVALTIGGIYKPGIRVSRDIDLFVSKEHIPHAYRALRLLGFKYIDPRTADQAIIFFGHHMPVMTNKQGTFIELHWRVTGTNSFKDCPLTETMMDQRQESETHKRVYIPNIAGMMAHTLYHGLIHHVMDHGPIFLFDLAALYKYNQNQWPEDNRLIKKLDLLDKFEQSKRLIERAAKEEEFSQESTALINELFEGFDWPIRKEPLFSVFGITDQRISVAEIMTMAKNSIQAHSHMWQLPITSIRYWFLFFKDLLMRFRNFRL